MGLGPDGQLVRGCKPRSDRHERGFLNTLHGVSDGDACDHNLIISNKDGIVKAKDNCVIDGSLDQSDTNKIIPLVNQYKTICSLSGVEVILTKNPFASSSSLVIIRFSIFFLAVLFLCNKTKASNNPSIGLGSLLRYRMRYRIIWHLNKIPR